MEQPIEDNTCYTTEEAIRKAVVEGKSIFCENEAVSDFIKLTIPELVCSYDDTDLKIYDLLVFSQDYLLHKIVKETSEQYWVQL